MYLVYITLAQGIAEIPCWVVFRPLFLLACFFGRLDLTARLYPDVYWWLSRNLCFPNYFRTTGRDVAEGGRGVLRHGPSISGRSVTSIPSRGGQIMPATLLLPPPDFWTLWHLWILYFIKSSMPPNFLEKPIHFSQLFRVNAYLINEYYIRFF